MEYRRLGHAGIKLSALGLGGWTTFGESVTDLDRAKAIIRAAYEGGINFFDIADAYARGRAEEVMGEILAEYPRHTLVISTKAYWPMSDDINDRGLSRKHLYESIQKSLKRIGTEYVDIYYCHRHDPDTPVEEVVRTMDDLIHWGIVLYWGTSEWPAARIAEAVGIARQYGLHAPRVEQPQYNLLVRNRVEQQVLPIAREFGVGLTTFSPLATGVLTGKYDQGIPEDSRFARMDGLRERWLRDDVLERVRALKDVADDLGITRAQLALAWLLHRDGVSSVITGATKVAHVQDNLGALDVDLTPELLARIDEIVAGAVA
jgi:voltage-dependent potassium channel beta subunit